MQPETTLTTPAIEGTANEYPTLLKRYQSLFIDLLFSLFAMFGVVALLDRIGEVPTWVRIVSFILLWGVYEPLCITLGCTIGNYLMGIRVRKANDETKRINILQAYIRFALKFLLGWVSFLTMFSDKQRRAIHDLAAGSVMITAK